MHNLPDLMTLLNSTHTSRKRGLEGLCQRVSFKVHLDFVEESYHLSSCDLKPLRLVPHWAVTLGNVSFTRTRMTIFRIHL